MKLNYFFKFFFSNTLLLLTTRYIVFYDQTSHKILMLISILKLNCFFNQLSFTKTHT